MSTQHSRSNQRSVTFGLIGAAIVIAAFPMFFHYGDPNAEEQFAGTDGAAESVVAEHDPDYQPWFEPLVGELPGEVESGLFALQSALGAGFLGFALGNYRGRNRAQRELHG